MRWDRAPRPGWKPVPAAPAWSSGPTDGRRRSGAEGLAPRQAHPAPLALGEAAPDAEALVIGQRVLQALVADGAARADSLRLAGGAALLREERLGVGLRAECVQPPRLVARRDSTDGAAPRRRLGHVGVAAEQGQGRAGEGRHGKLLSSCGVPGVTDRY